MIVHWLAGVHVSTVASIVGLPWQSYPPLWLSIAIPLSKIMTLFVYDAVAMAAQKVRQAILGPAPGLPHHAPFPRISQPWNGFVWHCSAAFGDARMLTLVDVDWGNKALSQLTWQHVGSCHVAASDTAHHILCGALKHTLALAVKVKSDVLGDGGEAHAMAPPQVNVASALIQMMGRNLSVSLCSRKLCCDLWCQSLTFLAKGSVWW